MLRSRQRRVDGNASELHPFVPGHRIRRRAHRLGFDNDYPATVRSGIAELDRVRGIRIGYMNKPILRIRVNLDLLNHGASEPIPPHAQGQMWARRTRLQTSPLTGHEIPMGKEPMRIASEQTQRAGAVGRRKSRDRNANCRDWPGSQHVFLARPAQRRGHWSVSLQQYRRDRQIQPRAAHSRRNRRGNSRDPTFRGGLWLQ